jgi:hypothetical protein
MAKDADDLAGGFGSENTGGVLSGFLAEEDGFDRGALWRLGSWAAASVCAVAVALYANQSSIGLRRDQVAAVDLARQAQQIQSVAKESQNETRRLASAIDTLNGDRDRLYTRVTVLEQGLDSVTGSIARQAAIATAPPAAATATGPAATIGPQPAPQTPSPVIAPVAATQPAAPDKPIAAKAAPDPGPATVASVGPAAASPPPAPPLPPPLMAAKSMMGPPDAAASKLMQPETPAKTVTSSPMPEVVASAPPADDAEPDAVQAAPPQPAVQRTEFAVDVGGANSVGGLRALWRGLRKSNTALGALHPIIKVRENSTGLGLQLRLAVGPLGDAAAAAKICAALLESQRSCETTVFDGQRLAMKTDEPASSEEAKPAETKPAAARQSYTRRHSGGAKRAAPEESAKKPELSTLSSFFSRH